MGALVSVETGDLAVVKQLPIIEDRLDEVIPEVRARVAMYANLVVTEENYKEMKQILADLRKERASLDDLRKTVHAQVEEPYRKFEAGAYRRLADVYDEVIPAFAGNVNEVGIGLKSQRQEELLKYFEEYRQSLGLDSALADPKKSGIKVGLSGSMKSLKEQVRKYLDGVDGDLKMIDTLEDKDEVLAEYRVLMSVTDAVRVVADRHKRIEELRKQRENAEEERKQREAQAAAVDAAVRAQNGSNQQVSSSDVPVAAPTVEVAEEAPEELYSARYLGYEIKGTMGQLKALKAFLKEELRKYMEREGIEYGDC